MSFSVKEVGALNERTKGFTLVELLVVIAILGLLASLIVPAVGYAMFVANKGMCKHKVKALTTISKTLHTLADSPIGSKWVEGFDWTAADTSNPDGTYKTDIANDNIKKSRLAFWRMIADPEIVNRNVSPGGPQAFICPGSAEVKEAAKIEISGVEQRDFPEPERNLFYSMFNQGITGIVPNFGTKVNFVVMGDRSPKDEGYELDDNSANHRWGTENTGQNICYGSGNVDWKDETNIGMNEDEIYMAGAATTIGTADVPTDTDDTVLMPVKD